MNRFILRTLPLVAIVTGLTAGLAMYSKSRPASSPSTDTIRIRYGLTVQNLSAQPIHAAQIAVSAPLARSARHTCASIHANGPYTLATDHSGHQRLVFKWDFFPPFATRIITVETALQWRPPPTDRTPESADRFLQPEPFIESDDAAIMALARRLSAADTLGTARAIHDWTAANIQYAGYLKRTRGARHALTRRRGDCTEYACLFAALCRANGIAARVMGGFVCPASAVLDLGDYHNWAEFLLNGCWQIADPQRRAFMPDAAGYIAFQMIRPSGRHEGAIVSDIVGRGLKVSFKK